MAQRESHVERPDKSSPHVPPADLTAMGGKQIEKFLSVQAQMASTILDMNQAWFDRWAARAGLAAELASQVTTAKSMPDAAKAWQDFISRQLEMVTEDTNRLLADGQKIAATGARLLGDGWTDSGPR